MALHTRAWPSSLLGLPRVYRCFLEAGQALGEELQEPLQLREQPAGGWRKPRWDTHTQMATRQMVGLGFQATLFTTPPTGTVFMQRAVHTSQNRTVQSSEPAGQDRVGQGQVRSVLPPPQGHHAGDCHGLAQQNGAPGHVPKP